MKISLHIEADNAAELKEFFAAFQVERLIEPVIPAPPAVTVEAAPEAHIAVPEAPIAAPESIEAPVEAPAAVAAPVEAAAEKPPRKPRGPNKPKPKPEAAVAPAPAPAPAPVAEKPKPVKAPKPEPIEVVSRQDLLDVFAEYVQRYGMNYGYTDISNLLQQHLGDGVRKASDVPETALPTAIGVIRTAIADNPFNRKRDYA